MTGEELLASNRRPAQSTAMRKVWENPEHRKKIAEATRRSHAADRRAGPDHPAKHSRGGIPNGYSKAEAAAACERADALAGQAMAYFEEQGAVERNPPPDSDEAVAKLALREAAKMAFGPGPLRNRLEALKVVLAYTKATTATAEQIEAQLASNARLKSCDPEWLLALQRGACAYVERPAIDDYGTGQIVGIRTGEDQRLVRDQISVSCFAPRPGHA